MRIDTARALPIIKAALKEDIGKGDLTTMPLVGPGAMADAVIIANEPCVLCGIGIAEMIMAEVDHSVRFKPDANDGAIASEGKEVAFLEGSAASILRAERTILNFLTFLSGIATRTRQYVDKVGDSGVKIMDTRKTIPLMRYLEKYAVSTGGGTNHRLGLYDQVLIKDNHILCRKRALGAGCALSLKDLVAESRRKAPRGVKIEIEVSSIAEFGDALGGKPDIIMLDNMRIEDIKACVEMRRLARVKPMLEASGGITLDTVSRYAGTGVDMISVGELTDSVTAIDMSLDLV